MKRVYVKKVALTGTNSPVSSALSRLVSTPSDIFSFGGGFYQISTKLNSTTCTWSRITKTEKSPPSAIISTITYRDHTHSLVLIGGYRSSGNKSAWEYEIMSNHWKELKLQLPVLLQHIAIYIKESDVIVICGMSNILEICHNHYK